MPVGLEHLGGGRAARRAELAGSRSARRSTLRWRPPRRSAAAIFERDSVRAELGVGATASTATASRRAEVGPEGHEGTGVVVLQRVAQRVHLALAGPDRGLVGPSEHLDALGELGVACDRAVVVPVGAHEVGEHLGVAGIGLGPRDRVAVPIARRAPSG